MDRKSGRNCRAGNAAYVQLRCWNDYSRRCRQGGRGHCDADARRRDGCAPRGDRRYTAEDGTRDLRRSPRTFMSRKRVAILISGRGSNMAALIKAANAADYPAEIALVLSNVPEAAGLA